MIRMVITWGLLTSTNGWDSTHSRFVFCHIWAIQVSGLVFKAEGGGYQPAKPWMLRNQTNQHSYIRLPLPATRNSLSFWSWDHPFSDLVLQKFGFKKAAKPWMLRNQTSQPTQPSCYRVLHLALKTFSGFRDLRFGLPRIWSQKGGVAIRQLLRNTNPDKLHKTERAKKWSFPSYVFSRSWLIAAPGSFTCWKDIVQVLYPR